MAAIIKQRTISAVVSKAIQLSNAQFGRLITLPVGWSKVRVGVRLHMTDSGANLTGTPRFAIGLGSGVSAMVGDAVTTNWIGLINNNASWTRSAQTYQSEQWCVAKKVGATLTTGTTVIAAAAYYPNQAATSTADRALRFVDITKGSPNYTLTGFYKNDPTVADVSAATFLSQMILASPAVTFHQTGTNQVIAFSEVAGTLDAVQIWWDHADALFEICDLAVAVLA